ncbi:MAG TPA: hypothetical protein VGS01_09670 [Candidatus Limnocylindria bacterium]|jgi:hypothetical protein|nr:hypothetical protein [Candidatus Limnocylindria bacterium]
MSRAPRAFYFGEHGPVWAGSIRAARTRVARFPAIGGVWPHEVPAADVPEYLHRDEGLLAIGHPVFQGTGGRR